MKLLKALILICLLGGESWPCFSRGIPLSSSWVWWESKHSMCTSCLMPFLSFSPVDTFLLRVHYWLEFYLCWLDSLGTPQALGSLYWANYS